MNLRTVSLIAVAALLATAGGAFAASSKTGGSERLRCKAKGLGVEFQARYEAKKKGTPKERRRFRVEIEGGAKSGLTEGQELAIVVDEVTVGKVVISEFDEAEVAGETTFSNRAKGETLPFPTDFPALGRGTDVSLTSGDATLIGCTFK